jgi:molybdate transport system substrate-binding protein
MMKLLLRAVGFAFSVVALASGVRAADITVSAASSLTNAFQEIGRRFERDHPGDRVLFNFGASGQLAQQIVRGAPVDVFAAADQDSMDKVEREGALDRATRRDFTRNALVLVVPADARTVVREPGDLRQASVRRIAIGNPESVPAGKYAKLALTRSGLWDVLQDRLIQTINVRQVLDYVARGEVDAGFVYATDALVMPQRVRNVLAVEVPVPILYPVAAVRGGGNRRGGAAFVEYLRSEPAREILARFGFLPP